MGNGERSGERRRSTIREADLIFCKNILRFSYCTILLFIKLTSVQAFLDTLQSNQVFCPPPQYRNIAVNVAMFMR